MNKRYLQVAVVGFAGIGLALAGCGTGTSGELAPNSGTPTTTESPFQLADLPDPCKLLTPADIEKITGKKTSAGTLNEVMSDSSQLVCDWNEGNNAVLQILIASSDKYETTKAELATEGPINEVSGIGQSAFATADGSLVGVLADDTYVQVSWLSLDPTPSEIEALAKAAVANVK